MKAKDLREKSAEQLNDELVQLHKEQFKLRMQQAAGQLAQSHLLVQNKKDVARVKTVLNQQAGK